MKVIICDDCRQDIEEIRKLCEAYFAEKELDAEIEELTDPMALLERNPSDTDILILDVELGDISGIEIKDELAQREDGPLVIFATSHPEAMSRAFNRNVIGFLLKPPDVTAFGAYMDSAVNILTADKHFVYPDGSRGNTGEILWIASDRGYADVYLADGSVKNLGKRSIRELADRLAPFGFLCISSGMLVNCKYIDDLTDDTILMKDVITKPGAKAGNVTFSISRRRKKECWEKYVSYCERMQKYT